MTTKRKPSPAPSRKGDLVFKVGLTVLFLTALAVTFWPSSSNRPVPGGGETPGATGPVASVEESTPPPVAAPRAPVLPDPVQLVKTETNKSDLAERADALLLEKIVESDDIPLLSQMGDQLLQRGDFTNAMRMFRRTVELDDENELNHFNLGLAMARLGQTNDAITSFRTALEIYPDFAEAHNSLGLQLSALGDLDEAKKHYEAAIEIQPDFPTALNNLGTIHARQGRYAEAVRSFEQALVLDTNYVSARFNLANALLHTGHTNEALGRLQDLVNEHPDYQPAQIVLMRLMSAEAGR